MSIRVIADNCTGCGQCVEACPFGQIEVMEGEVVIRDGCTLCGACGEACPFEAIHVDRPTPEGTADLERYRGVFVFAEQREGRLAPCSLELLGEGRKLADVLGEELAAVLPGHGVEGLCPALFAHGAEKVYLADHPGLGSYRTETYVAVLTAVVSARRPSIFLFGATTTGRDLAPRLAARVRTGLTADCTGLAIEEGTGHLLQTRPAWGGNIMAAIKTADCRPQMATVRPRVMKRPEPDWTRSGEVVPIPVAIRPEALKVELVEAVREAGSTVPLEEADLVVAGGRGLQGPENFRMMEELAGLLNGAVGASRPAVDSGWKPHPCQVGQTGKTVGPKVYVACGISGAVQHRVGMESSERIVAINKDPEAPIMRIADWAVVGDLFQIVPALIQELKRRKGLHSG